MKKKLPKSTFNKAITMETEHALINFFAKNIICNKFQEKSLSFITIAWISPPPPIPHVTSYTDKQWHTFTPNTIWSA